jgi:hypothetical protein
MRGIEAFLMLGFIGLVGFGVWNERQWLPTLNTHAANSTPTAASTTANELVGKTKPKSTRARNNRGLVDQAVAFEDLPAFCGGGEQGSAALCCETACSRAPEEADSSVSKPEAPVSSKPEVPVSPKSEAPVSSKPEAPVAPVFPTRDDLSPGATGVQIRARFGEPEARVTETKDGVVFERYYYYNHDHTQVTVARLKGGVIVSSENTLP